ncbi:MAG: LamG domain-containing protein [Candidatus Vogelbacteria bacterium]|nr:LamG domain-containing protein [Candidatus Vogelbacteria bacterium]
MTALNIKYIWFLIIVALATLTLSGSSEAALNIAKVPRVINLDNDSSLVGWWTFDGKDIGLTYALDKSASGNVGTLTGTRSIAGKIAQARSFNGTSDYISVGTANLWSGGVGTVSAWVKMNSGAIGNNNYIVAKGDDHPSTGVSWGMDIIPRSATTASLAFLYGSQAWATVGNNSPYIPFTTNVWHHVVMVANSNNTQQIYLDGVLQTCDETSCTKTVITPGASLEFNIGKTSRAAPNEYFTNGSIDDVRVYSRALSAAEITRLYQAGSASLRTNTNVTQGKPSSFGGPVARWTFDARDIYGTTAYDGVGSVHGTIGGGTTKQAGQLGQALRFDGVAGSEVLTGSTASPIPATISIVAWQKNEPGVTDHPTISKTSSCFSNQVQYGFGYYSDKLYFYYHDIGNGSCASITYHEYASTNAFTDTAWHQIVATYTFGDPNSMKMYRDGVLLSGSWVTGTGAGGRNTGSSLLSIGRNIPNGGGSTMKGAIDEVRVYDRALGATEIAALYKTDKARVQSQTNQVNRLTNGLVGYWTFDGKDSGSTYTVDKTGSYNLTFTGSSAVPGKLGQGRSFNGTSDVLSNSSFANLTTTTGTLAGWFKASAGSAIIVAVDRVAADPQNQVNIYALSGTNGIGCQINKATGNQRNVRASATFALNTWHHIACVKDGSDSYKIYFDGISLATNFQDTGSVTNTWWNDFTSTDRVRVGRSYNGYMNGAIDDVRVYNRALSTNEVYQLYKLGK